MAKKSPRIPTDLSLALWAHPIARKAFDAMPPAQQQRYGRWVRAAKKDPTRRRRILQSIKMVTAWGRKEGWV